MHSVPPRRWRNYRADQGGVERAAAGQPPAPPNAMSRGRWGRKTWIQLWDQLVRSEGCNNNNKKKSMNMEWGVFWVQGMAPPSLSGQNKMEKICFEDICCPGGGFSARISR